MLQKIYSNCLERQRLQFFIGANSVLLVKIIVQPKKTYVSMKVDIQITVFNFRANFDRKPNKTAMFLFWSILGEWI